MEGQFYYGAVNGGGRGAPYPSLTGDPNRYVPGPSLTHTSWKPGSDPSPAMVGPPKYTVTEKYSSPLFMNQIAGLMPPESRVAAQGSYRAVQGNYAATAPAVADPALSLQLQFSAAAEQSLLPGMMRPAEALYQQPILGNLNSVGQNEALISTNSLIKRPRNDNTRHLPVYPQRPGEKACHQFMLNRRCAYGDICKFDHPPWVPEGGVPGWKQGTRIIPPEFRPERPGAFDCPYDICTYGFNCKFNHPKNKVPEVHPISTLPPPSLLYNMKGLPIRLGERDCPFYLETGSCHYGAHCQFSHPDGSGYAANNPPVAAALVHSAISSSAPNLPNGVIIPASAPLPAITPYVVQTAVGVNPTIYPQRPGEKQCDFYMKTGMCKFGERCKFHHPIDRSAPTPSIGQHDVKEDVKLTLAGLPRRKGSLFCRDYMETGFCKAGAACHYDHPPPAEVIARTTDPGSTLGSDSESEEEYDTDSSSEKKKKSKKKKHLQEETSSKKKRKQKHKEETSPKKKKKKKKGESS